MTTNCSDFRTVSFEQIFPTDQQQAALDNGADRVERRSSCVPSLSRDSWLLGVPSLSRDSWLLGVPSLSWDSWLLVELFSEWQSLLQLEDSIGQLPCDGTRITES